MRKERYPEAVYIMPLGPQGPKIGVGLLSDKDEKTLRNIMRNLSENERFMAEIIIEKIQKSGLTRVDC